MLYIYTEPYIPTLCRANDPPPPSRPPILTVGVIVIILVSVVVIRLTLADGAPLARCRVVPREGLQLHKGGALVGCHSIIVLRVCDPVGGKQR